MIRIRHPLDSSRIALGLVLIARTTPVSRLLPWPVSHVVPPLLGWPEHGFRAAWGGLALPDAVVIALCLVRTAAAVLFTLGVRTTAAGIVAAVAGLVVASQDVFGFKFTLHTLFVGTLLLSLSGAGRSIALVPSARRGARPGPWLVRAFVASVYAWAGIAKVRGAWLSGEVLRALHGVGYLGGSLADVLFASAARCRADAWAVVLVELALGPLLLARRTRTVGLVLAVGMHAVYEVVARPDVYGWIMGALLVCFLGDHAARSRAYGSGHTRARSRWCVRRPMPPSTMNPAP